MLIREKDHRILLQIFGEITEPVEVLAYGSRVTGDAHDGSDLDLVIRRLDGQPVSTGIFETLIEKIRDSNIPILVDLHDWALLPENFHRQIEKQHEVLFVQKNQFIMKPRLIFDIACFTGQPSMSGSLRYAIEVLKRFVESEKFDIVAICSLPEEEFALRNLSRYFHYQLPFQSKETEHFVLPDTPASSGKSFLRKIEDALTKILPDNRILKFVTDSIRTVKWKLSPPPFLTERKSSPFYEKLVTESDIYFSPFHPLIPELGCKKSIRKIIVIHDLIPVIFADLYKGHRFFQKYPWESITPDTLVFTDSESTKRDLLKHYPAVLPEQVRTILLAADQRFSPCFDRNKIESILNKYSIP
ncbi:MAG: nucleotidyltransferase domain-containing protein, partial [Planctomycetaceae bacterium]|nr:nucleotidyltransferase domain-containing protein [Planctomycetaceae bacterium]